MEAEKSGRKLLIGIFILAKVLNLGKDISIFRLGIAKTTGEADWKKGLRVGQF